MFLTAVFKWDYEIVKWFKSDVPNSSILTFHLKEVI